MEAITGVPVNHEDWIRQVATDTTDWGVCLSCATKVDEFLAVPSSGSSGESASQGSSQRAVVDEKLDDLLKSFLELPDQSARVFHVLAQNIVNLVNAADEPSAKLKKFVSGPQKGADLAVRALHQKDQWGRAAYLLSAIVVRAEDLIRAQSSQSSTVASQTSAPTTVSPLGATKSPALPRAGETQTQSQATVSGARREVSSRAIDPTLGGALVGGALGLFGGLMWLASSSTNGATQVVLTTVLLSVIGAWLGRARKRH